MATCVKNLLLLFFIILSGTLSAGESFSALKVIKSEGPDLAFRELLIAKTMSSSKFKCTVTQESYKNAVKKLLSEQCDMILVKMLPQELQLEQGLACKVFAYTPILVIVNKSLNIRKMKISDLRQIWNGDINQWSFFNTNNIFSIHRFAMPFDDSTFKYLQRKLPLRDKVQHFPLSTPQQTISMTGANPNAIGICVFEENLQLKNVNLVQLTDENGKNININMPHTVIFRIKDKNKVENFFKVKKK